MSVQGEATAPKGGSLAIFHDRDQFIDDHLGEG